jgi:phospholipid-transporting ATPase
LARFAFVSGFSGMPIFNTFILATYNTFFTALLPLVFIFDRDVSDCALELIPELYRDSKQQSYLNYRTISLWFGFTLYQSVIISAAYFWITSMDLWNQGFIVITIVMIVQVFVVLLNIKSVNVPIVIFVLGSFSSFVIVTYIVSILPLSKQTVMYHVVYNLGGEYTFYLTVVLLSVIALIPLFAWVAAKQYRSNVSRSSSDFIRMREQNKKRKGELSVEFYANLRDLIKSKNRLLDETNSGSPSEQETLIKMHIE